MKNLGAKTFIAITFIAAFLGFFTTINKSSAATCEITSADWYSKLGTGTLALRTETPAAAGLEIRIKSTPGSPCAGWNATITLEEVDTVTDDTVSGTGFNAVLDPSGTTRIPMVAGEYKCDNMGTPNCIIKATVQPYKSTNQGTAFSIPYNLQYGCKASGDCKDTFVWSLGSASNLGTLTETTIASSTGECKVISTKLNPFTTKDGFSDDHSWYSTASRHTDNKVTLTINTENCTGQQITVGLRGWRDATHVAFSDIAVLQDKTYTVPSNNSFTIQLIAGEESCKLDVLHTGVTGADCMFHIVIGLPSDLIISNYDSVDDPLGFGNLNYECDGGCDSDVKWEYAGDSLNAYPADLSQDPIALIDGGSAGDPNSACSPTNTDCYELSGGFAEALGHKFDTIKSSDSLGSFVNAIIAWVIGIGGAVTIAIIMYEGFMFIKEKRDGNPEKLSEMKSKIFKTVLGFLLLLSVYVILKTINPDLLNLTPKMNILELGTEAGDGSDTVVSDATITAADTKTKACPAGVVKTQGFWVCKDISAKFSQLIAAAQSANITLGGGGYRNPQAQIDLRTAHCGGSDHFSVYEKDPKQCSPWTALPGTSRHESGLAIDFTCNNLGTINKVARPGTQVCFDWLQTHAGTYGLQNLPAENWHWSIDGH